MTQSSALAYPYDREAEVALRDGSTVHVRPVRPTDGPSIRTFLERVSRETIGFRFFGSVNLEWAANWSVDVDYADRFALVAESGAPPVVIAHALYVRGPRDRAEVAFLVDDRWQGKGISTILLAHLAEVAVQHGISTFTADVLPHNHRMIEVFRGSGFPVKLRATPDAIEVELPTSLSAEGLARFEERERMASIAAVRSFLEPRRVAVIGASRREDTVGGRILHNLLAGGFGGAVYAVNDHAERVQSLPAYRSVREIPTQVDLAIVVVPAARVVDVARDCAAAGVRALLVISAGFAEAGEAGAWRQRQLVEVCRGAGMRVVGPNCLGVLNTARQVKLNATFAPHFAVPGHVGFLSQSGGVGIALIEEARRAGVGLSSFVSVGNKVDLSGNDLLRYWEDDPATDVALLYLESFGNPRKFARVAPWFARRKPLLAVKSGRSPAGARATSSHTGAILAASDVTVDALFEQAGVVRTDTLHELLAAAALLSTQPVPHGGRVGIITNAGGPGIMCADACHADGVEVPALPAAVREELAEFLPPGASLGNPIDMIATASADDYGRALRTLIDTGACDVILVIFVPALATQPRDVARAICEVAQSASGVPIAAVFMSASGPPAELRSQAVRVPGYEFPEDAARAVALAAKYGRWRARPQGTSASAPGARPGEAAAIISRQLGRGGGWLTPADVVALLGCYGLPLIESRVVRNAEAAVAAARELAGPVALKASALGLIHKTDAGGVRLGLESDAAVRTAAHEIAAAVAAAGFELDSLVVQPMAPGGVELIVGVASDHSFGPVVACGAGGVAAELIKDVAARITPLTDHDAHEMLRSLRTFPLLDGYRGAERCDVHALEDAILRVAAMVEAHPEVVELDCNPLIARPDGVLILDARVRVETAAPPRPLPSLGA
jgi:acetyl coenzyme A synthetase (ADP forming)-like protein